MIDNPDAVILGDLNLVRAVGRAGLRAILYSRSPRAAASRYCAGRFGMTSPVADPDRAARDLCALGQGLATRPVLYYSNDAQLLMVSRHRDALEEYFRLRLPEAELVADLVDKARFQRLADEHALPVPRTQLVRPGTDIGRLEPPGGYPCILKPVTRVGWFETKLTGGEPHKVLKVVGAEELRRAAELMRSRQRAFILQEFIDGRDDQIFSFHGYFDDASRLLAWFVGRKVRTYPLETGRSSCLELVRDPEVAETGRSLLQRLGFRGVVKIDFKRDVRAGRLYLLEINARFNLWHYLGAVSGVNLPHVAYRDLHGTWAGPPPSYRTGRRWISLSLDARSTWRALRRRQLSPFRWLHTYLGPKVFNTFAWDDPRPSLVAARTFAARAVRTLVPRSARVGTPAVPE